MHVDALDNTGQNAVMLTTIISQRMISISNQTSTHTHRHNARSLRGRMYGLEFMFVQPADEVDSGNKRDNHSVDVTVQAQQTHMKPYD